MFVRLFQIGSSPQYGEGCKIPGGPGVLGSRTGTLTWVAVLRAGSRMGMSSVLTSGEPYIRPFALNCGFRLSVAISSCRYALGLAQSHSVMTMFRSRPWGRGGT